MDIKQHNDFEMATAFFFDRLPMPKPLPKLGLKPLTKPMMVTVVAEAAVTVITSKRTIFTPPL